MPSLLAWLPRFALPTILSIDATYTILRVAQRKSLAAEVVATDVGAPDLSGTGKLAAAGLALKAFPLLAASSLDL